MTGRDPEGPAGSRPVVTGRQLRGVPSLGLSEGPSPGSLHAVVASSASCFYYGSESGEGRGHHQPELGCAAPEAGVRDDPRGTCWREAGPGTPFGPRLLWRGCSPSTPLRFSWAYLPRAPLSPAGVGKVVQSRPGLRPGGVGLTLPGLLATGS